MREGYCLFLIFKKFRGVITAIVQIEYMKQLQKIKDNKIPLVAIDTKLDKLKGRILFPKKFELASKMLENAKLPEIKYHS